MRPTDRDSISAEVRFTRLWQALAVALAATTVAGCGGGGDDSASAQSTPTALQAAEAEAGAPDTNGYDVVVDGDTVAIAEAAAAASAAGNEVNAAPEAVEERTATIQAVAAVTPITVRARAMLADNIGAIMEVRLNGALVGKLEVRATAFTNFLFTPSRNLVNGDRIDVVFTNDVYVAGVKDRNLLIESITFNGKVVPPTTAGVVYDKGNGAAAFDGLNTEPGRVGMPDNGAMRFVVSGVVAPPPPPLLLPSPAPAAPTAPSSSRVRDGPAAEHDHRLHRLADPHRRQHLLGAQQRLGHQAWP